MTTPIEYANQGAAMTRGARSPLLKASIAAFGFVVTLGLAVLLPVNWLMTRFDVLAHYRLISIVLTVTTVLVSAAAWCGFTVFSVVFVRMVLRVRAGEAVRAGDILDFDDVLIPGAWLGAPIAAAQLLSLGQLVWAPLDGIGSGLADLLLLVLIWAPIEMALRRPTHEQAWHASVGFWLSNPVGNLIAVLIISVRALIDGRLIHAPGIYAASLLAYYTEKAAPAPAPAVAPGTPAAVG